MGTHPLQGCKVAQPHVCAKHGYGMVVYCELLQLFLWTRSNIGRSVGLHIFGVLERASRCDAIDRFAATYCDESVYCELLRFCLYLLSTPWRTYPSMLSLRMLHPSASHRVIFVQFSAAQLQLQLPCAQVPEQVHRTCFGRTYAKLPYTQPGTVCDTCMGQG